jgi:hypothetical protein
MISDDNIQYLASSNFLFPIFPNFNYAPYFFSHIVVRSIFL